MRSTQIPTLTQIFQPGGTKLQTFEVTAASGPGRNLRDFAYDDTMVGGCASGHFTLYADFETTLNMQAGNTVQFAAGGGHLVGSYVAGTTSIVLDDTSDFLAPNVAQSLGAPAFGTAQQYALIDDGVNNEKVLVTAKSGFQLTLAAGLVNAYAAGVTVAILRYSGIIKARDRNIARSSVMTLTTDGFWSRLNDPLLDYNIVAQECGSAIVGILAMAAQTIPEITFPSSVINTNVLYTGTGQSETAQSIITKILQVANGNVSNITYVPIVDASKRFQLIVLPVSGAATQTLELFQGISTGKNLVPDSSVRFPTSQWSSGGLAFVPRVRDGQNGFSLAGTGAAQIVNRQSAACATVVGSWYVVSAFMDATGTTSGNLVTFANATYTFASASVAQAPPGAIGRFSGAAFQATSTTTYVWAHSNSTVTNAGATSRWCGFQLELVANAAGVASGYEATFPGATQDVLGDMSVRDQDITSAINVVRVEGGKKADGAQCRVIVRDTTSITTYHQKESVLSQPSLTDEATAAAWGMAALRIMAYPKVGGTAQLTFADLTTSARDFVQVTGFDDGSTFTFTPTNITTTVDPIAFATQALQIAQVLPDINAVIAEIVGEKIQRAQLGILANPGNFMLVQGCAISNSGTNISVALGIAVINAARVLVTAYGPTAQPNNSTRFMWARSTGAIVALDHPTPDNAGDGFFPDQGILLGIVSVLNGVVSIIQTPSTGVGTVNFAALPNSAVFPGISSIAITLSAEGAVSASARTTVNLVPGLTTSATWLAAYLTSFAKTVVGGAPLGSNDNWINPKAVQAYAFSNSFTFTENGLDPSQDYDLGLQIQSVAGDKAPALPALLTLAQPSIARGTIAIALIANGSTFPAPTFTLAAGYPKNGPSPNGMVADILLQLTLTNLPTDGSVTDLQFYTRVNNAVPATWVPHMRVSAVAGVLNMSIDQMEGNALYDIACGYLGAGGLGALTTIATAFAGKTIGIPTSYLIGTAFVATVTVPVLTITTSVNNVAANVAATFTITNQPTDGSLARIGTWFRKTGAAAWTPWSTLMASSAGSATPAASGSYSTNFTDLLNGTGYEFGVNGISIDGSEGLTISTLGTIVAQTLAIGTGQLLGGALPTPTVTLASAATGVALTGLVSRVTLAFTLTNQPTDGSLSRLTMWYRVAGQTNYAPGPSKTVIGLPTPAASQAYAGIDFADLQAGVSYDFGVSYENTQGNESSIAAVVSGFAVQSIAISGAYMIGTNFTPTITSPVLTVSTSVNNVAANVAATFNITNQPADASLARIGTWFRKTGVATWTPWTTITATTAGSPIPTPAVGAYATNFSDLTNGTGYEFGVNALAYDNTEGPIASLGTITAQTLAIGTGQQLGGALPTPTVTAASAATGIALTGLISRVTLAFTLTNQPTDGSLSRLTMWYRVAGQTNYAPGPSKTVIGLPTPAASQAYTGIDFADLQAGASYDFGVSYENTQGNESAIAVVVSGFAVQSIAISGAYMIGTNFTPTITSPVLTITTSVNNIAANVAATFNITNQPADASLARVGTWFRKTGAVAWTPWTTITATTAGAPIPTPALGSYATNFTDLTNGTGYEFGVNAISYDNTEGPVASLGTITAQTFVIGTGQQLGGTPTPSAMLAPPPGPSTGSTVLGAIAATTYFVKTTYAAANGETLPSSESSRAVATNSVLTVTSPAATSGATGWYVYVSTATGTEKRQGGLIAIGTAYTEPTSNITTNGVVVPTTNTATTGVATDVSTLQGMTSRVSLAFTLTNQPTDGSLSRLTMWYRATNQVNFAPGPSVTVAGLPNPTAIQSYSNIDFADLQAGIAYDFAVSYENTQGDESLNLTLVTNYTAQSIGIPSNYLTGGIAITPTFSSGSAVIATSANGVSAACTLTANTNNQPTDGSLSRVTIWKCLYVSANGVNTISAPNFLWKPLGTIPAPGVGSNPAPATGTTVVTDADLENGQSYKFALSYENAQGGESILGVFVTNFAAQLLTVGGAAMPAGKQTSGPTITASALGVPLNLGGASINQPFTFSISDWTINNAPTWFGGFQLYGRIHGDTVNVPAGSLAPLGTVTNIAGAMSFGPGATYDVGIAFLDTQFNQSVIVWPAGLANLTPAPIGPGAVGGSYSVNLVPDSSLKMVVNANLVGPYWSRSNARLAMVVGGDAANVYRASSPGGTSFVDYAFSKAFPIQNGRQYVLSCWLDARTCSGPFNVPFAALYTGTTTGSIGTLVTNSKLGASYSFGLHNDVAFTAPGAIGSGTTLVNYVFSTNGTTIGTSLSMNLPQVETGTTSSAYKPNELDASGTVAYSASATQFQNGINVNGFPVYGDNATIDSLRPGAIGADVTQNNTSLNTSNVGNTSSGVVSLSTSGGQVNMVADSDIAFGTGTGTYWMLQNGWFTNAFSGQNRYYYDYPANATRSVENSWATNINAVNYACNGTQSYVASVNIAADGLPSGNFSMVIMNANNNLEIGRIQVNAGSGRARRSASFTAPSGCTAVSLLFQINVPTGGAANHYACTAGQFQIENGTTPTGYKPNLKQHSQGTFERGAHHPTLTNAVAADGTVVGYINGVNTTRFVTGQSAFGSAAPANDFNIQITLPNFGTWYLDVSWTVSASSSIGSLFSQIKPGVGLVGGFTNSYMETQPGPYNYSNQSCSASCQAGGNQMITFQLEVSIPAGGTQSISTGNYSIRAFRLS